MKSLSRYWAGDASRALGRTTNVENRLAIALGPVRSVIRVIDDSTPPMSVDWCQVGSDSKGKPLSLSYTDFADSRIAVNPLPIMEGKLSPAAAIDVVTGFAMHEASHSKHSRDRWKHLIKTEPKPAAGVDGLRGRTSGTREVPAFEPMRIAGYLYNLVEDVRIEAATSKEYRGFAAYFDNLLDWMWHDHISTSLPTEYGPKVDDKIKTVFMACRFTDKARSLMPPELQSEVEWWAAWRDDYLTDTTDVPTTIQRALDHLGDDPASKREMEEMAEAERKERERGEKIRAQIDRLMKEGVGGAPMVCITEDGEVTPLTAEQAEKVGQLVKEGLSPVIPHIGHGKGDKRPEMRVRKPLEDAESRRAYVGKPDATVEALRAAIVFRPEMPRFDLKLQKSGELDDEELYRWGMGDDRLFTQRVIEEKPDALVGLLVDLSGSMVGWGNEQSKIDIAQRLAQLFVWALHDSEGVETRVWGHTGDSYYGHGSDVFRIWEPGDPMRRLGLIKTLDHGNNYDGYSLEYCVSQMRDQPQPEKTIIVLSDGYPAGSNYGDREAQHHIRTVCTWARSQGVNVIQIAIDSELRPADQARMYGPENWLPYTNDKQLPRDLARVLARFAK